MSTKHFISQLFYLTLILNKFSKMSSRKSINIRSKRQLPEMRLGQMPENKANQGKSFSQAYNI